MPGSLSYFPHAGCLRKMKLIIRNCLGKLCSISLFPLTFYVDVVVCFINICRSYWLILSNYKLPHLFMQIVHLLSTACVYFIYCFIIVFPVKQILLLFLSIFVSYYVFANYRDYLLYNILLGEFLAC